MPCPEADTTKQDRHGKAKTVVDAFLSFTLPAAWSLKFGGHSRIRTYDFHRVKVALYR